MEPRLGEPTQKKCEGPRTGQGLSGEDGSTCGLSTGGDLKGETEKKRREDGVCVDGCHKGFQKSVFKSSTETSPV